jgi:PAS domain-containing protein
LLTELHVAAKIVTAPDAGNTKSPAEGQMLFGARFAGARPLMPVVAADPITEIERLQALLDTLPSCLMRVGADGTLLAVSDSALDLLGCRELAAVLGTNFVDRIRGDAAQLWADFVQRVFDGGSGSAECEMEDAHGVARVVVLLGTALAHHPDGVSSLLVTVRDISTARRLEASLQEQEGVRRAMQAALDAATARRRAPPASRAGRPPAPEATLRDAATATVQQLRGQVEDAATDRRQLGVALEQLTVALHAAVTAASAVRQALKPRTQP